MRSRIWIFTQVVSILFSIWINLVLCRYLPQQLTDPLTTISSSAAPLPYSWTNDSLKEARLLVQQIDIEEARITNTAVAERLGDDVESILLEGDILLPVPQLKRLLEDLRSMPIDSHRAKRSYLNFERYPISKWDSTKPVPFAFAGFSEEEKDAIRDGIRAWQTRTCINFIERDISSFGLFDNFIFFQYSTGGCYAVTGKVSFGGNTIALSTSCALFPGAIIHEIGHAFGLFHEHSRRDRDMYVRIFEQNIQTGVQSQFAMINVNDYNDYGKAYDIASSMHYPPRAFSSNGELTIEAYNVDMQSGIGQRAVGSFADFSGLSDIYCPDACEGVALDCKNGGKINTATCNTCLCQDGFGGPLCEELQASVNANCGGELFIAGVGDAVDIWSPHYGDNESYPYNTSCTWRITTSPTARLYLQFYDRFGILASPTADCILHWVEVKYSEEKVNTGARYCYYYHSGGDLYSEGSSLLVLWRAHPANFGFRSIRSDNFGFKARITSVESVGQAAGPRTSLFPSPSNAPAPVLELTPLHSTGVHVTTTTTTTSTISSCGFCSSNLIVAGLIEPVCTRYSQSLCTSQQKTSDFSFTHERYNCTTPEKYCCIDSLLDFSRGELPWIDVCRVAAWSTWEPWSRCSTQCGGCGIMTRRRTGQAFGTRSQLDTRPCNQQPCRPFDISRLCDSLPASSALCSGESTSECCSGYKRVGDVCKLML